MEHSDTKLTLIEAAGELFAAHGFDGTSVRAICERAGANVAAINYHFGSKENLHREVLLHVVRHCKEGEVTEYLDRAESCTDRAGFAELLTDLVRARFQRYFSPDEPPWHWQLMMRSLSEPSQALEEVVREFFIPEHEALKALVMRARPDLGEEEAGFFAFSVTGEIVFYSFARIPMLMLLGKEEYDEPFVEAASGHVASVLTRALGLAGDFAPAAPSQMDLFGGCQKEG